MMIYLPMRYEEEEAQKLEEILKDMGLEVDTHEPYFGEYCVGFDSYDLNEMSRDEFNAYVISEVVKRLLKAID